MPRELEAIALLRKVDILFMKLAQSQSANEISEQQNAVREFIRKVDDELHEICKTAVGHTVFFIGTNGNEYSDCHGQKVEGIGTCLSYHDSHGLCIVVKTENFPELCVDPVCVKILDRA